jgi:hypothetical protein
MRLRLTCSRRCAFQRNHLDCFAAKVAYGANLLRTRITCTACHLPPNGAGIPRAFSSSAAARADKLDISSKPGTSDRRCAGVGGGQPLDFRFRFRIWGVPPLSRAYRRMDPVGRLFGQCCRVSLECNSADQRVTKGLTGPINLGLFF